MAKSFIVEGVTKDKGINKRIVVEAENQEAAARLANQQGLFVSAVLEAMIPQPVETPPTRANSDFLLNEIEKHLGNIRWWVRFWSIIGILILLFGITFKFTVIGNSH